MITNFEKIGSKKFKINVVADRRISDDYDKQLESKMDDSIKDI
jgi:hypothetical protein